MGISRTQLRDTLSELDREGFITRRHGVGTVINRHVLEVPNRMDIETEFLDIIRQMGHEPSVSFIDVTEDVADENSARKLFYSRQYFVDSVIKHTVLRKKFQVFFGIFY